MSSLGMSQNAAGNVILPPLHQHGGSPVLPLMHGDPLVQPSLGCNSALIASQFSLNGCAIQPKLPPNSAEITARTF